MRNDIDECLCDVLVVGSGAGGMATAIVARDLGLNVLVVEKAPHYGGTTAVSGGVVWIPGNEQARAQGRNDSPELALQYLRSFCESALDERKAKVYVKKASEVLEWFADKAGVRFVINPGWADYRPNLPGGTTGRSLMPAPFDGRLLEGKFDELRPPLASMMIFGGMMVGRAELPHFLNMLRSPRSFLKVTGLVAGYVLDRLKYSRGTRLSNGNALAASLAHAVFQREIPLWLEAPAVELIQDGSCVVGALVERKGKLTRVLAHRGVVLAAGGFPGSEPLRRQHYPHVRAGKNHHSLAPADNTGDGLRMGSAMGGGFKAAPEHAAAWAPVSLVPQPNGSLVPFPHFIDRCKPGYIAVNRAGKRFVNEAISYHDFVPAMIEATLAQDVIESFLICDHHAISRYGLGAAPPNPGSRAFFLKQGYIVRANSLEELAKRIGVDAAQLGRTVSEFNQHARLGEEPAFGKGADPYQHFNGDLSVKPNPNVAPIEHGPFYAVRLLPGDIGTFAGLSTDEASRVTDHHGHPIPGLYAVGNDAASFMGGTYPAAGITIGPAMTFGYLAAHEMAKPEANDGFEGRARSYATAG